MNSYGGKPLRQALAVAILAALLLAAWALILKPVVELPLLKSTEIDQLASQITELNRAVAEGSSLRRKQSGSVSAIASLRAFWSGANPERIAANMQDVVRTAAQQADGRIVSASGAILDSEKASNLIVVRTHVEGTLATLQLVLEAIEAARPRLFVDSLDVVAMDRASTRDRAQQLSFELQISGYSGDDAPLSPKP